MKKSDASRVSGAGAQAVDGLGMLIEQAADSFAAGHGRTPEPVYVTLRDAHFRRRAWEADEMECRIGCGACCIAPSISSPIPGMPHGKPAGVRCIQLDDANRCKLFGKPDRPDVCVRLRPSPSMCGASRDDAIAMLTALERATQPA